MNKPLFFLSTGLLLGFSASCLSVELSGEEVFNGPCKTCHAAKSVVPGSPKMGDRTAWAPRIAKGMDTLFASAINGVPNTLMSARGTCGDGCTDGELKAAVEYMVNNSK